MRRTGRDVGWRQRVLNGGRWAGQFGIVGLLAAGLAAVFSGCQSESATPAADRASAAGPIRRPYRIVTTCGMVTDIVRNVAGDKAEVVGLMGAGVDPHLYKPTSHDVKQLLAADVVFYSGLMLEGRMADTFTRVGRGGKPVFAVTQGIDERFLREPPEFQGHWDPHVWMDVSAWSECVRFVGEALAEYDPENAAYYRHNVREYREKLAELDAYIRQVIGTIPERQRVLVTAHDAFGYFSRAYGIDVHSVQGLTTESEPSIEDRNRLVDFLVERKIGAIFVESSVSQKHMQAILEDAAARGWHVRIGGELFSDAMGAAGTYEGTYIGMMDHNATVIARALGGTAPERGLHGKLAAAHGEPSAP